VREPNMNALVTEPAVFRLSLWRSACLYCNFLGKDGFRSFYFVLNRSFQITHLKTLHKEIEP
jgi:hypothetical protein